MRAPDDSRHALLSKARPLSQVVLDRLDSPGRAAYGPRQVREVEVQSALNDIPDIGRPGRAWGLNTYTGCLHDCAYCYVPDLLRVQRERWGSCQIPRLIEKMRAKETSRQTVVTIYDARDDAYREKSKDDKGRERKGEIPCTIALQFLRRSGRLHCITTMRSQDAFGLLPQDVFHFTMFQELVAASLGVEMGSYVHQAGSMHYYPERVGAHLDEAIAAKPTERQRMPRMLAGDQMPALLDTIALEERIRVNAIEVVEQSKEYGKWDMETYLEEAKALPPFWGALAQSCLVHALIYTKAWARLDSLVNRLDPWLLPSARLSLKMKTGQEFLSNYAFSYGDNP